MIAPAARREREMCRVKLSEAIINQEPYIEVSTEKKGKHRWMYYDHEKHCWVVRQRGNRQTTVIIETTNEEDAVKALRWAD